MSAGYAIIARIEGDDGLTWQLDLSTHDQLRQRKRRDLVVVQALLRHCQLLVDAALAAQDQVGSP